MNEWFKKRKEYRLKSIINNRGGLYDDCPTCGKTFKIKNLQHKYCTPKCRKSAQYASPKFLVLNRDNFRCIYCGTSTWEDSSIKLNVDHIKPRAKGGSDKLSNLVTSCQKCNAEKSDTTLINEEEIKQIVDERNKKFNLNPNRMIKS